MPSGLPSSETPSRLKGIETFVQRTHGTLRSGEFRNAVPVEGNRNLTGYPGSPLAEVLFRNAFPVEGNRNYSSHVYYCLDNAVVV